MSKRVIATMLDYNDRLQPKQLAMSKALWAEFEKSLAEVYADISKLVEERTFVIDSASVLCKEEPQEERMKTTDEKTMLELCEEFDAMTTDELSRVTYALMRVKQTRRGTRDGYHPGPIDRRDIVTLKGSKFEAGVIAPPMTPERLEWVNSNRRARGLPEKTMADYAPRAGDVVEFKASETKTITLPQQRLVPTTAEIKADMDRMYEAAKGRKLPDIDLDNEAAQGMYHAGLAQAAKGQSLQKVACDCGAVKCRTTHADWCSTRS